MNAGVREIVVENMTDYDELVSFLRTSRDFPSVRTFNL